MEAKMILCNWQCPKTSDLKEFIDGIIEISSNESMLGRLCNEERRFILGGTHKNGLIM